MHVSARRKGKAEDEGPVQSVYLHDLSDFVRPVAQSLSWVWQDTNRPVANPGQPLSPPSTPKMQSRSGSSQHLQALQASAQSLITSHLSTGGLSTLSSSASLT